MMYNILYRELEIGEHEPHKKPGGEHLMLRKVM